MGTNPLDLRSNFSNSGTKAAPERYANGEKAARGRGVSDIFIIITGTFADQLSACLDVAAQEWSNI